MPYYCTVPRCTSMAGKAKNVSFHQFPRDQELAKLWNDILKRGKPYTKYSKVCSLHFKPEDYTITSVGKNKGQWRTLRKDAVPSRNLPSEYPAPSPRRDTGSWVPVPTQPPVIVPAMQQQMAQAIYLQTMLAMQAATNGSLQPQAGAKLPALSTNTLAISELENILRNQPNPQNKKTDKTQPYKCDICSKSFKDPDVFTLHKRAHSRLSHNTQEIIQNEKTQTSYKCEECAKCFIDPDVFTLHKRSHNRKSETISSIKKEKENCDLTSQDTLRANPILANLLKSVPSNTESNITNVFDSNVMSIENQIMTALTSNMESYIRNLSSMLTVKTENDHNDEHDQDSDEHDHSPDQNYQSDQSDHKSDNGENEDYMEYSNDCQNSEIKSENFKENSEDDKIYGENEPNISKIEPDFESDQNDVQNVIEDGQNEIDDIDKVCYYVAKSEHDERVEINKTNENSSILEESNEKEHIITKIVLELESLEDQSKLINEHDDNLDKVDYDVDKSEHNQKVLQSFEGDQSNLINEHGQYDDNLDKVDDVVKNEHDQKVGIVDNTDSSRGSEDNYNEPNCDIEDLKISKDSSNLVLDVYDA